MLLLCACASALLAVTTGAGYNSYTGSSLPAASPQFTAAQYSYDPRNWYTGPAKWGTLEGSETCAAGRKQSPIDIERWTDKRDVGPMAFNDDYNATYNFTAINTGKGLKIDLLDADLAIYNAKVCGVGVYKFDHIRVHWGYGGYSGSEHFIRDKPFVLEVQLFHYSNLFSSYAEASFSDDKDARCVISQLYRFTASEPTEENLDDLLSIAILNATIAVATSSADAVANTDVGSDGVNLFDLINLQQGYYFYEGSDTIPPCHENVNWVITRVQPVVDDATLQALLSLNATETEISATQIDNVRPLQQRGGRGIGRYVPTGASNVVSAEESLDFNIPQDAPLEQQYFVPPPVPGRTQQRAPAPAPSPSRTTTARLSRKELRRQKRKKIRARKRAAKKARKAAQRG